MGTERTEQGDFARLRALIQVVGCSSVTEFEFLHGDLRLFLKRREGAAVVAACPPTAPLGLAGESAVLQCEEEQCTVVAPLAGTVFLSPSLNEKPYVEEGDIIEEGQVVALIEAMKMFNEVQAVASGRVARLLVASGQSVAAGNPILVIVPCQRPTPRY